MKMWHKRNNREDEYTKVENGKKKSFLARKKEDDDVKMINETFRGVNMNCDSPGTQHALQTIQTAFCNTFTTLYSGIL
jgi:hypothetical protein